MGPPAAWPAANWGACSLRCLCRCAPGLDLDTVGDPNLDTQLGTDRHPAPGTHMDPGACAEQRSDTDPRLGWEPKFRTLQDTEVNCIQGEDQTLTLTQTQL